MGGIGSGNWFRTKQTSYEETKRLDIRSLKRLGFLHSLEGEKRTGLYSWSCNGSPSGSINIHSYSDRLELVYSHRKGAGEWYPIEQTIHLSHTSCNYGGERKWLICPRCHKRKATLCSLGAIFICRKCAGLRYESQLNGGINRLIDRKHRLGARIFDGYDGEYGYRKKGMHRKTFNDLLAKYLRYENDIDAAIALTSVGRYFAIHNEGIPSPCERS